MTHNGNKKQEKKDNENETCKIPLTSKKKKTLLYIPALAKKKKKNTNSHIIQITETTLKEYT